MKVFNYAILITGIVLLFAVMGFPTGADALLTFVGLTSGTSNVTNSGLWDLIWGSAGIIIGLTGGIVVGFLTKSSPENYIIFGAMGSSLGLWVSSLHSIINYCIANTPDWISALVILILGVLSVGYVIAIAEFFRGTD